VVKKIDARDITGFTGLLALSGGAGWAWPPAGPMVFGVLLIALAVVWRGR
jgi:hypothetical protein